MKFVNLEDSKQLAEHFYNALVELCQQHDKIGLLLPGGSNISIATEVINKLTQEQKKKLDVILSDERYGPNGHPDSNEQQYIEAGLDLSNLNYRPILKGLDEENTIEEAKKSYSGLFTSNEVVFGFLGMGADGHIAGVLPNTPGVQSPEIAVLYSSPQYQRLTPTLSTLSKTHKVFVGAFGSEKVPALKTLKDQDKDLNAEPALVLNNINDVTVFTDHKEII